MRPAGIFWHEKVVKEIRVLAVLSCGLVVKDTLLDFSLDDFVARGQENIRAAFQKEHPEDEILVFRRVHAGTQNVRRRVEVAFEFGEGKLGHGYFRRRKSYGSLAARGRVLRENAWASAFP